MDKLNCGNRVADVQQFDWGEMVWVHEPSDFSTERLSAGIIKFFPGKRQCSHVHFGEEQILYVIRGSGIHVVNGEKKDISEGMILHCPPHSQHEVINTGAGDLVFLIIYTPSKLRDVNHHVHIVNEEPLSDILETDLLESIQRQISEIFDLPFVITDNEGRDITAPSHMNAFCTLSREAGLCGVKCNTYEGALKEPSRASICCHNITTMGIPIKANDRILGYIKCGYFVLNKPEGIEESILKDCGNDAAAAQELIDAYHAIPLIPRSRLYALEEVLGIAANLISNLAENHLIERELSARNSEILKTKKEKIHLEDELKQANIKLLKSAVGANFDSLALKPKTVLKEGASEYPFLYENKLKDTIKKLEEDLSFDIMMELTETYEKRVAFTEVVKEIFEELTVTLSRMIYEETGDEECFEYQGAIQKQNQKLQRLRRFEKYNGGILKRKHRNHENSIAWRQIRTDQQNKPVYPKQFPARNHVKRSGESVFYQSELFEHCFQ